jgi:hypothetical protein
MIRKSKSHSRIYIVLLVIFALAGLAVLGWQAAKEPLEPAWEMPTLAENIQTATPTPTPGWWDELAPRPVVPTMPGKLLQATPTPAISPTENPMP